MVVISVSITESSDQIISGIPKSVSISTNIPATIFYTLDGSDPTIYSSIYTSAIIMPTDQLSVTLKVFASNGIDNSAIITETYTTNILNNLRVPHAATTANTGVSLSNKYPFGTNPNQPQSNYLNPGEAGTTVNDSALPRDGTAYDGTGNKTAETNLPYVPENYDIVYPKTNSIGEVTIGVGDIPSKIKVQPTIEAPQSSNSYDKLFDPRAFVIFQDASKEDPTLPPNINRISFTLENSERARTGNNFFTSGLDSQANTGTFLRSHFNPRDNTITYYYLDNISNKWIISKIPYQPKGDVGNLYSIVLSKNKGAGMVFQWYPFNRRILF
jgi:hypothetical protein